MKREHLGISSLRTATVLVLRLATLVATLVLMTRTLGPTAYGVYASAATLAVLMGLLPNFGAGYLAMSRSVHDPEATADVWRYGWPLTIFVGSVLFVPYLVGARWLTDGSMAYGDLAFIAASELFGVPLIMLLGSLLQARHRVPMGQLVMWIPIACRVVACAACLWVPAWRRLHPFIVGQGIATFVGLILAVVVTSRMIRLVWRPRRATRTEWLDGGSYAAMNLVAANPAELDKVLAPLLLKDHLAGIYTAASRVMIAAVMPVTALLLTSQPRLFEDAANMQVGKKSLQVTVAWASFGLGMLAMVALVVAAPLIAFVLGPSFAEVATLLPWVAIALPFLCLRLAAGTVLAAMGKPIERLLFEVCGIAWLVPLLYVGASQWSARGMALALASAEAMIAATGWWRIRRLRPHGESFHRV